MALAGGSASVALLVALPLAGGDRGLALYAYVLFLGAVGLRLLTRRVTTATPAPALEQLLVRSHAQAEGIGQLDSLARRLAGGESSASELHHDFRPLVRQIAGARLARRHGVDLDRFPERAQRVVAHRTWELIRPDREPPAERFQPGWSKDELQRVIEELEEI